MRPRPLSPHAAACRSCHAPIFWALTRTGKLMPVDAAEHDDGNIALDLDAEDVLRGRVLAGRNLDAARAIGMQLHRSHFVTCPNAGQHRRAS